MVSCLLANHGFVYLEAPFIVQLLPAMLAAARGAVFNGIPPYDLWEHPPAVGKIPPHGSDAGSYLVGEVFGARSVILLKDVDGVYDADPKTNTGAKLIPEIGARELLNMQLATLADRAGRARPADAREAREERAHRERAGAGQSHPRARRRTGRHADSRLRQPHLHDRRTSPMSDNPFVGSWTYRSLRNDPDVNIEFNELRFGRGTIVIQQAPMQLLTGTIGGPGWSLALNGARAYGNPMSVRFQGKGIINGAEWIYDYQGWLVPAWPNGVQQVPAMVGSIVRTIPHPGSPPADGGPPPINPAGVVASWYAVKAD